MDRPPQLPALVRGQKIRSGPFNVIVTDDMVRQRERENEELARRWQRDEERRRHLAEGSNDYFAEFQDQKVRRRFIRRVFSILTLQLIFTALLIAAFLFVEDIRDVVFDRPYLWTYSSILFLFTYLAITCSDCARESPCNYVLLILLTLSLAFLTATLSVWYSTEAVLLSAVSTALVTLIITCISACTNFDLTVYVGTVVIVNVVFVAGIVIAIITLSLGLLTISKMHLLIALLGTLLFSMWLFFDLHTIMGGGILSLDPDEVVYATAHLYVDIIMFYRYFLMLIAR